MRFWSAFVIASVRSFVWIVEIAVEGVKKFGYTSLDSTDIGRVENVVDVASVVDSSDDTVVVDSVRVVTVTELVAWIADNAVVGVVTDSKSIKAQCGKIKTQNYAILVYIYLHIPTQ